MTPEQMKRAIPRYYQAWADQDRAAMARFVGDPLRFTSPCDDHIDRAEYFRRCWPNPGMLEGVDIRRIVPAGADAAFVLYEARPKGGKTIRNAEYLRFAGERLASVEVVFGLGPGAAPATPGTW